MIGILEGTAYLWERSQASGQYAWELVASRRIRVQRYSGPGAGYTLMEPGSRYSWAGTPVVINSHGLRGPETTFEKPPGTFRLLNLGDSVAMGWGVREEDTYGVQLERLLNAAAGAEAGYEVINAGVPGWNLENVLAYLQAVGLKYDPDLILLDVTIVNDIYGRSALREGDRPPFIEWLRANTFFWPFLTVQFRWLEARAEGRERIDVIDPPTEPSSYFPLDPQDERWDAIWDQVMALKAEADERGIPLVMVLFPLEYQVLDETFSRLPQEVLAARANQAGIPVLDLWPAYREACLTKPGGPCQLEDRYLFADVWMHPSALGHSLAASEIYDFLTSVKFLN